MSPMTTHDILAIWLPVTAVIVACRVVPIFALRGRALPPRVVEALGYIPPAAFAALVANDLFSPGAFAAGPWPALLPAAAAAVVVIVAKKTRSMLWCCIAGVVAYIALGALPL